MKLVFRLEDRLRADPMQVHLAQTLTLNPSKPQMGLRGRHGLFGSPEWWASIREGKMPLLFLAGVIQRAYVAGQDEREKNNTIDLKLDDGSERVVGIYVDNTEDADLFLPGQRERREEQVHAAGGEEAQENAVGFNSRLLRGGRSVGVRYWCRASD